MESSDFLASISTTIELRDNVTYVIDDIIKKTEQLLVTLGTSFNATNKLDTALKVVTATAQKVNNTIEDLPSIIQQNEPPIKQIDTGFSKWGQSIIIVNQALGLVKSAIGSIKNVFGDVLGIANENTRVNTQLGVTLRNNFDTIEETRNAYEQVTSKASELSQKTGISETSWVAASTELATYYKDLDALSLMMETFADYAVGMTSDINIGTQEAVNLATQLGKISVGSFEAMTKKGFEVSDAQKEIIKNGTEMEQVAVIASIIGENWNGLSEAMGNTPVAIFARMNNAFDDLKDVIGQKLTPMFATMAQAATNAINSIIPIIEQSITWIIDNIDTVIMALTVVGTIVGIVAGIWFASWVMANLPLIAIIGTISLIITALVNMGISAGDVLGGVIGVFNATWEFIQFIGMTIANFFIGVWESIVNGLSIAGTKIMNIFRGIGSFILGIIQPVASALDKILNTDISGSISNLKQALEASIEATLGAEGVKFERFETDWSKVANKYNEGMQTGQNIVNKFKSTLDDIGDSMDIFSGGKLAGALGLDDYATSASGGGKALKTDQQKPMDIKTESIKYLHDITTRTIYQPKYAGTGNISVTVNAGNNNISSADNADYYAERAAELVIDKIQEAYKNDLG
jgi:hypothetical protein